MNLKTITASVALVLSAAQGWTADVAIDAQRVFATVSPSVVTIKILDEQGALETQGSGVVVGAGLVATNCHVVQEASAIRIAAAQGELPGEWTRQMPGLDLCLLSVSGLNAAPLKLRPSATLTTGEPVYAVGDPLGFGLAVSAGLIAVFERKKPYDLLVSTAPLSPGSSGGGLFDGEGRLIGITTAVLGTGQNLNRILAADQLASLIDKGEPRPSSSPVPAPEKRWYGEADALQTSGNWAALEQHAQVWSQSQPGSANPLVFLAMAQSSLKRDAEAETTLRRALALDQYSVFGWFNLARVLARRGRPKEAEQALKQAEDKQPIFSEPNRIRAEWLRQQGKPAEALVQIKESIRKNPGHFFMWNLLGHIENDLGNTAEASRAFNTALRLGRANTDADGRRRLAELPAPAGSADGAIRIGNLKDASNDDEGNMRLNLGLSEMKQGRLGPAEDAIRKALALSPKSAAAWNGLGSVLLKTNRLAEADDAYTKAIELDPNHTEAFANRAQARRVPKSMALALNDARRAIELSPQSAAAWRAYALVKIDARDYREANAAFAKLDGLTELSPDELASWGDSLLGAGDLDGALKILKKAEAKDPKLVRMCLVMAKALGQKGDLEGALGYENRAIALDGTNSHAWSGKGFALMKLGRLPAAVEALETAVRLDPALSNAWINLGEAQMRNRNLGRAIQALEKAMTLAPAAMDGRWFLAQSYLNVRLPAKSREQAEILLQKQPNFAPALGLATTAYLMEGNPAAAAALYVKLKALAPSMARAVREQAIAAGLIAAKNLPE
jgi:tetratricopeptide (TPR) repeat protein